MAEQQYTYYCKVTSNKLYTPGVYTFTAGAYHRNPSLISHSIKVWRQGPKGGVKLVKDRWSWYGSNKYVTKDEKAIKEFMWVKLQAQPYIKGA